jgi:endonuclease/exonuclease/phosphatase family metal-dependent hydrolase
LLAVGIGVTSCAHRPAMIVQSTSPRSVCTDVIPGGSPVTWIVPDDARDHGRLIEWCRTVGPLLVESPADRMLDGPVGELAVVSWNLHVGGGDLQDLVGRLRRGEFTDGRPVPHFVLLLQEAHRQSATVPAQLLAGAPLPPTIVEHPPDGIRRDIRIVAANLGLHVFYAPSMRNHRSGFPEDRGSAILSTLPLSDLHVIELPFERQRRVALFATVSGKTAEQSGWTLRLADVHVDTSLAFTRGGPFAARRRQAEALLEALGDSELPTLVGGDFNTWLGPGEPALRVMRRAFPATPAQQSAATWRGPLGARAALDYVFVRGKLTSVSTRMLEDRFGSDHHPLLTLVSF